MIRPSLKRSAPLKAKKPRGRVSSAPFTYAAWAEAHSVATLPRKSPLSKRGARAKREEKALDAFRIAVLRGCFIPQRGFVCARCDGDFDAHQVNAHHKLPKDRLGSNDPENGIALCEGPGTQNCHKAVHAYVEPWREFLVRTKPERVSRKPSGVTKGGAA